MYQTQPEFTPTIQFPIRSPSHALSQEISISNGCPQDTGTDTIEHTPESASDRFRGVFKCSVVTSGDQRGEVTL
ncbi:hypothetical protein DBV39_01070 [Orrella marina]|uniref:Uncharacterized protein n=1 Tax=Orrella marina TaxID=2163011 RepID=A0A2R4XFG1_9BURK|nr:hypothetical protein DBV39_01070 [Orrella marina]